jgi:hypothetical protein
MEISKLFKAEPQDRVTTSIGDLCLFAISWGDLSALFKDPSLTQGEAETLAFMRRFTRYVCYPPTSLREEKYKPDTPALDDAQLQKLTSEDFERVATSYLAHNEHLYRSRIEDRSVDEKGQRVIRFRDGDIIHPKNVGESDSQFLERLTGILKTETEKSNADLLKRLRGSFSSGLFDEIQRTQSIGDNLLHAIAVPARPNPILDPDFLKDMTEQRERSSWAPFKLLKESIDSLVGLTKAAIEFSVQGNKTQTDISAVLKSSSDEAKRTGRINVRLTIAVLAVTTIALLITSYQVHEESLAGAKLEYQTEERVRHIVDAIGNVEIQLKSSQVSKRELEELNKRVEDLTTTLRRQSEQIERLEKAKTADKNDAHPK